MFDTVVKLVNLGFAGVGIAIFLLVAVMRLRSKSNDPASIDLEKFYLKTGVGFAVFCGLIFVFGPIAQARFGSQPVAKGPMVLTFSPRFDTEKLPFPIITLPDGSQVQPDTRFETAGGMIKVSVDDALQQIKALRETAVEQAKMVTDMREQRDTLAATMATASTQSVVDSSVVAAAAETRLRDSIQSGNFTAARKASLDLQKPMIAASAAIRKMRVEQ
ncbi:MAG: hypothetical protein RL367_37 [Pseudomonadota bacterium]|jgi:hypothetical protein